MKKVKILQMQKLEQSETFLASDEEQEVKFKSEIEIHKQEDNCFERLKQKYKESQLPKSYLLITLLLVFAYLVLGNLGILVLPKFIQPMAQQQSDLKVRSLIRTQIQLESNITELKQQIKQSQKQKDQLKREVIILEDELTKTHKLLQKYQSETKPVRDQSVNWIEQAALLPLNSLEYVTQPSPEPLPNPIQPQKEQFQIQSNFWLFSIEQQKKNYLKKLMFENNKYFAELSNFTVNIVTKNNYHQFLSNQSKNKINNILNILEDRLKTDQKSNLKQNMESIEKILAMFSILYEKGGIIATQSFTITEDFDWIKFIKYNIHVNRGNFDTIPQVVGFFSPYYSQAQQKLNKQIYQGMERVDRYMVLAPTLQSYFVAARKGAQFISRIINQMISILQNPQIGKTQIVNNAKQYPGLQGKDIYFQYYLIAVKKVIISKQDELDSKHTKINDRRFAIDYFGIFNINCHYAPYKIKVFWKNSQTDKLIQNLAKYDIKQFYANVGDLRYIDFSTIPKQLNDYLERITQNQTTKTSGIMNGSYIQKMYFPNTTESFIYENKERPFVNKTAEPWTNLPKIIWVYWDKGLKNSKASTQLCVENLRRMGAMSGIIVNEVNDTNLGSYLDDQILEKINYTLTNAKVKTYPQSKGDLYRLSLLTKYGGIYLDSSFLALENFDWLLNIGRYPSEFIFNRYGNLPKVLMYWHPHFGSPFDWTIDEQVHSKVQWHLSYQNNFIVAQKGAQFIKEWLQLYLQLLLKPYEQIINIFKKCKMEDHKWITSKNHYLLAMDSAKCIVGRKQFQIKQIPTSKYKSASDYYKLWSMSGYLGQQKFRSNTNYDNPQSNDHTLFYRYPQQFSQGLVGKVRHLTKLYSVPNQRLNAFIGQHLDGDFRDQSHSQSIFMKYLYNKPYKLGLSEGGAIVID